MATINSGANAIITINVGEQYTVTAENIGVIEILGGYNWNNVVQTINLSGAQKTYTLGKFQSLVKANIKSVTGSVGYSASEGVVSVGFSRNLRQEDSGKTLDCANGVELTLPAGLVNFGCVIRPDGIDVIPGAGVEINGATDTLTTTELLSAINPTSVGNAYDVVGAE
jgi:hypothetical protein